MWFVITHNLYHYYHIHVYIWMYLQVLVKICHTKIAGGCLSFHRVLIPLLEYHLKSDWRRVKMSRIFVFGWCYKWAHPDVIVSASSCLITPHYLAERGPLCETFNSSKFWRKIVYLVRWFACNSLLNPMGYILSKLLSLFPTTLQISIHHLPYCRV